MEAITLFVLRGCPYCVRLLRRIEMLLQAHPEWKSVPLQMIDERENPVAARQHDYYYVPALYLGDRKVYEEGVLHTDLESIFRQAVGLKSA